MSPTSTHDEGHRTAVADRVVESEPAHTEHAEPEPEPEPEPAPPGGADGGGHGDEGDGSGGGGDDEGDDDGLGRVARWVGSDEAGRWLRWVAMGAALAFLVGAVGYVIGVKTTQPRANAVDVGFLEDMTAHHDQAVTMALAAVGKATDPTVRQFASEVVMFQRWELGLMTAYQADHGVTQPVYDPERTAMAWMGMPTPLRSMPGMATDDQVEQLRRATGVEVDRLFLTLLSAHHLGGVHMAEHAAEHAEDPRVRELAGRMARNQKVEIKEYAATLKKLGGG